MTGLECALVRARRCDDDAEATNDLRFRHPEFPKQIGGVREVGQPGADTLDGPEQVREAGIS